MDKDALSQLYLEALNLELSKGEWGERYYACEYPATYDIMKRIVRYEHQQGRIEFAGDIARWIENGLEIKDILYYGADKDETVSVEEINESEKAFDTLLHMAIDHLENEM